MIFKEFKKYQGICVFISLQTNVIRCQEDLVQFVLITGVWSGGDQISTLSNDLILEDTVHILWRDEVCQGIQFINLHEQIDGIVLLIVFHESRNNLLNQVEEIISPWLLFKSMLVLRTNIRWETTKVLRSPVFELFQCALLEVLQRHAIFRLTIDHCKYWQKVGQLFLNLNESKQP